MIKKIGIGIAVLIVAVLAFAATKPDTFRVERTASIAAPAEAIFPLINDFREWEGWSPWEKLDPNLKRTFSGSSSGEGAVYAWEGNSDAGAGRMEIVESVEPSKITVDLRFTAPFEANNVTVFSLVPNGESTTVTWVMEGPNPYIGKLMSVFMSMDSMVGKDFEEGLTGLAALAEE